MYGPLWPNQLIATTTSPGLAARSAAWPAGPASSHAPARAVDQHVDARRRSSASRAASPSATVTLDLLVLSHANSALSCAPPPAVDQRRHAPIGIAARRLDLHHVCPEVGEQLAAVGQRRDRRRTRRSAPRRAAARPFPFHSWRSPRRDCCGLGTRLRNRHAGLSRCEGRAPPIAWRYVAGLQDERALCSQTTMTRSAARLVAPARDGGRMARAAGWAGFSRTVGVATLLAGVSTIALADPAGQDPRDARFNSCRPRCSNWPQNPRSCRRKSPPCSRGRRRKPRQPGRGPRPSRRSRPGRRPPSVQSRMTAR